MGISLYEGVDAALVLEDTVDFDDDDLVSLDFVILSQGGE